MKYAPWLLLAALVLYRRTWGACDCPALRRRLAVAHRETRTWQHEASLYRGLHQAAIGDIRPLPWVTNTKES